ncbi:MFS transporter [Sulfobacillus acidophilus TPY]|uniref:Major facilitator superfamily MFS_1 n=1 Tax=Sulfobacillus acidophilus (strain ATCC 700253 / DSM 10332 / NAL) TaxID=679936 RepID=G8TYL1_SULAD|nr:MFS transporter [Sulfobacillus acidophilus TPY]AEW06272.1 major facilitator superfamily MFS_1 [Sulfobacillus acidophilus DSM 10332]
MSRVWDPEIPRPFYVLMAGRFMNLVGNSLVFPFMTIYLATRLHASLGIVGLIMTLYGASQVAAQLLGGVLSDTWGRKRVMITATVLGALTTVEVGLAHHAGFLITMLILMGLTVPLFQPASMAMVGDLVPESKLSHAYSLMRMASNAGIVIGPMIGGFLADRSFESIFLLDALSLVIFFVIIVRFIPETRPSGPRPRNPGGIRDVLRDRSFLHFSALWGLTGMVYSQLYQVVPAYLHVDLHYPPSTFGYLAAENALGVVLLQWPLTRLTRPLGSSSQMALGVLAYAGGFLLMLLGHRLLVFAGAVMVITIGENIINPAASTWVAERAPEALRGRYMGVFGLANRLGAALGPSWGGWLLTLGAVPWLLLTGLEGGFLAWGYRRFGHARRQPLQLPASR